MKLSIIALSIVLSACASHKETKELNQESEEVKEQVVNERPQTQDQVDNTIYGRVDLSNETCDVLIHVREGDILYTLYPVNLSDEYKVQDLKMTFTYTPSRAPSPEGCDVNKVAVLNQIKVID